MDGTEKTETDWGPFGRPLFADPEAQALSRVGVVDVGSNSVRLVVFDGAARSPAYFFNEKIMCALGAGMAETGRLNPEGRLRALDAIRRFQAIAETIGILPLTAVATAAVRDAEDGPDFVDEVARETGLKIHVIDGQEEARLSAQGVLLGWPGSYGLVCDIGGSSMELAELDHGEVGRRITTGLGPLRLMAHTKTKKALKKRIRAELDDLAKAMPQRNRRLFLVGGSWRAIARIDMERRGYPLTVLHEYRMTARAITETAKYIEASDLDDLRARCAISSSRMALVPIAAQVLKGVLRVLKPKDITVSSYGIREGMLYEQMPQILRERDPLIEACRFAEAKDARTPGFGRVLHEFVSPLFRKDSWQRKRIIKAACLLHDVSWRAHPDYRAEVTFDNVTRASLGGLKHEERVFLGLALHYRYTNRRGGTPFERLFALLTEKEQREAEILGKAMRFGAMLWLEPTDRPARLKWRPRRKVLELTLTDDARPLFGEVARARFLSLASVLEAETEIKFDQQAFDLRP